MDNSSDDSGDDSVCSDHSVVGSDAEEVAVKGKGKAKATRKQHAKGAL
jgi:hypothetical protein